MGRKDSAEAGGVEMAKKAPFFSHDMNARHDPKISAMRGVYGAEGFGWFWMLIELMAESDGYQLDCKSKYAFNAYAMQLQCKSEDVKSFVSDCIEEFELFVTDDEYFWSNSLRNRMQYRDTVSEKRKEAANKRWEKNPDNANEQDDDANALDDDASGLEEDAIAMQNHANKTKLNETKQNKTKVKEYIELEDMPNVRITQKELDKLNILFGSEEETMDRIVNFASWILMQPASKQKTASAYLSIMAWNKRDLKKQVTYPKPFIAYQSANDKAISQKDAIKREIEEIENNENFNQSRSPIDITPDKNGIYQLQSGSGHQKPLDKVSNGD